MVEEETALDATVKSDAGTGPPENIGEIAAVRQEKENGVKEVEKEKGRTDTLKVEEENGVKEEREGEAVKKEEVDKKMEEEGDAKEGKEKEEAKEEVGDADMVEESNVEEKESEEEVKEDAGLAKLDAETKEDAGSGNVDEEVKESTGTANVNDEVKEDAGDAQTEEGDLKGEDKHGKVEEKTEASLEVKGMNKRRRGQRREGKRKVVKAEKGEMKEEEAEEEKGSTEKKEAAEEKGTTKKKVSDEKVVAKKEKRDEEKGDAPKKDGDRERRKAMKVEVDGEKRDVKKRKELSSPVAFSPDRPVRERKSVNRLVATIENEPVKEFVIQKGQGTPLKDIPNVAYKLAKKRNEENLKLLHTVIYGRKAKASHVKSNISQFSGFVWPDNEEKQHAKIKERLDKFVKNKLIEFCDVLDIPIAKATVRKEDLVSKIMDFLISPHATTDTLLAEKDQPKKYKRTIDRITPKKLGSTSAKRSARKRRKIGDNPKVNEKSTLETEEEDEEVEGQENDNGVPHVSENEASDHSESEKENDESEGEDDEDSGQRKPSSKKSSKRTSAQTVNAKKARTPKKVLQPTPTKSSMITSFNQSKSIGDSDTIPKVFSRKKKNEETPKKSSVPSKSASRARTGKKVANEKEKHKKESGPSEDELRKTICDILNEADFNTATFTDILKQLARHFKTDLTPKKSTIKLMIHEELTKLADEAEDDDDEGDEENEENPEPAEVKA